MKERLEANLGAAALPAALLAASALGQLFLSRPGGSLAVRLGWPAGAVLLLWQWLLLALVLGSAAAVDAAVVHRSSRWPLVRPMTTLASCGLVTFDLAAWALRVALDAPLDREHLGFVLLDLNKISVVTTSGERSLLLALPLAGIVLGATLVTAGGWIAGGAAPGRVRRAARAAGVLAMLVAIGHGTTLLNRREVLDLSTARWTTIGQSYAFHLSNDGLWLPQLTLGGAVHAALSATAPGNASYVRVGDPIETVPAWAAKVDRAGFRPLNVLLIQIDSVRWNELIETGGDPRTLPSLSRLAQRSLLFDRCYAPTSETAYSLPAMLDGQYALRRPVRDYHDDLDYPCVALSQLLGAVGYRTAMFSSHWLAWQRMDRVIRPDQYGTYVVVRDVPEAAGAPAAPAWLRRSVPRRDLTRRISADLETAHEFDRIGAELFTDWLTAEPDKPFYAVLAQISAHYPYRWPDDLDVPFRPYERERYTSFFTYPLDAVPVMRNAYHNALYADDVVLGQVLDTLDRLGLTSRTLVVIASDHGQSFGEHGLVTHARGPFESQIRTPLVVAGTGRPAERRPEPVSVIDIPPTILGVLGLPRYGSFQGWDVLDPATPRDRPIYFSMQSPMTKQEAVIAHATKYIEDFASGRLQLYDLQRDPDEAHNLLLSESIPGVGLALQDDLRAWHMSQLVYYANPALHGRFFPPRYRALWGPPPSSDR
ncbi:MAG: sulfatase-like hydrolase/transferase [Acidobacteriia bacterium]|nr:sulfatase-like hydrolase/transferase [Terriglobia bacterium]